MAEKEDQDWYRVDRIKPREGMLVRVMSHAGQVTRLIRKGKRWWFPDYSQCVQLAPAYWQPILEECLDGHQCLLGDDGCDRA